MPGWQGSNRQRRLPPDWAKRRARILRRDHHRCTWPGCTAPARDVDHIQPGDDHSDSNLRSLCPTHHGAKSSAEGHAARYRFSRRRPAERHPGMSDMGGG